MLTRTETLHNDNGFQLFEATYMFMCTQGESNSQWTMTLVTVTHMGVYCTCIQALLLLLHV